MTCLVAYDPRAWAAWRSLALGHIETLYSLLPSDPDGPSRTETMLSVAFDVREIDMGAPAARLDVAELAVLGASDPGAWPDVAGDGTPGPGGWVASRSLDAVDAATAELHAIGEAVGGSNLIGLLASFADLEHARAALHLPEVGVLDLELRSAPQAFEAWWARLGAASALMAGWNATSHIESGCGGYWEPALDLALTARDGRTRISSNLQSCQFPDFAGFLSGETLDSVLVGLQRCVDAGRSWAAAQGTAGLESGARERATDPGWWVGADPDFGDLSNLVWNLLRVRGHVAIALGPDGTWSLNASEACEGQGASALRLALVREAWMCRT